MPVTIRPEQAEDRAAVWSVNQRAFGGDVEADLVDSLRTDGFVEVSLVAEQDREIVGHILFTRVEIVTDARRLEALSLAPMAVRPGHQQQGIGSQLVEAGLDACRDRGHKVVVVLGHPEFYARFGFSAELAQQIKSPFGKGDAWMAMELAPASLTGIQGGVKYSPPFLALLE